MQNKNVLIYIAILVAGLLIGGAVATRYYGVGPLAGLKGTSSSANMASPDRCWRWYIDCKIQNPQNQPQCWNQFNMCENGGSRAEQ